MAADISVERGRFESPFAARAERLPDTIRRTPGAVGRRGAVAVLGDTPAFAEPLLVGRPNVPDRAGFMARIDRMLDTARLTNAGPMVEEFEQRVARIAGARHCIATCNGTLALELATGALDLRGEVIVPSFTFVATVHALWRQGIRPVFCDVDPNTHCLDPDRVEDAISSETTGILGVTLWGNLGNAVRLRQIAQKHGLRLLYDSAHSFGCQPEEGATVNRCDAEIFSFHATKCIQSIEGGAIATNDDSLADKLRLMVNFGFAGEDVVRHLGTNGKMNEAEAAMGLASLDSKEIIFAHNRSVHHAYSAGATDIPGLRVLEHQSGQTQNHQYVVVEIDPARAGLTRDEIVGALRFENVVARRYFHPGCHRMEPYRQRFPRSGINLPVTERLAARVMVLPSGLGIDPAAASRVTDCIAAIVARAPEVRVALAASRDDRLPSYLRNT